MEMLSEVRRLDGPHRSELIRRQREVANGEIGDASMNTNMMSSPGQRSLRVVDAEEGSNMDVDAEFLAALADRSFPRRLALFDKTSRDLPERCPGRHQLRQPSLLSGIRWDALVGSGHPGPGAGQFCHAQGT